VQRFEQSDELTRDFLLAPQRFGEGRHAIGHAGLAQIAEESAEQYDRARRKARSHDQFVEAIVFRPAFQHLGDGFGHDGSARDHGFPIAASGQFQDEALDMALRRCRSRSSFHR
jgi:hypothetical protein